MRVFLKDSEENLHIIVEPFFTVTATFREIPMHGASSHETCPLRD